jgi:hypothetical protein
LAVVVVVSVVEAVVVPVVLTVVAAFVAEAVVVAAAVDVPAAVLVEAAVVVVVSPAPAKAVHGMAFNDIIATSMIDRSFFFNLNTPFFH